MCQIQRRTVSVLDFSNKAAVQRHSKTYQCQKTTKKHRGRKNKQEKTNVFKTAQVSLTAKKLLLVDELEKSGWDVPKNGVTSSNEAKNFVCDHFFNLDHNSDTKSSFLKIANKAVRFSSLKKTDARHIVEAGNPRFVTSIGGESGLLNYKKQIFPSSSGSMSLSALSMHASQKFVGTVGSVAMVGRSNVGKSSLINELLLHKNLARRSKTPGRTQLINYFQVNQSHVSYDNMPKSHVSESNDHSYSIKNSIEYSGTKSQALLHVVDLPGYGFANAPAQVIKAWHKAMQMFVKNAVLLSVRELFVLVDARHGLLAADINFLQNVLARIDSSTCVPYSLVMTKVDKVPLRKLMRCLDDTVAQLCGNDNRASSTKQKNDNAKQLGLPLPRSMHMVSSKSKMGIASLRTYMLEVAC